MTFRTSSVVWAGIVLLAVGCQQRTQVFSVAVRNESSQPLMVGLAKDGPPFEDHWASPEQVARGPLRAGERAWGVPVAPGKTAEVLNEKAALEGQTAAMVRVYASAPTLPAMLAISRGSPNRLDIPLLPGENSLVVTDEGGRLSYKRAGR